MKTVGEKIYALAKRIFPIYRCLMGNGVRETLDILEENILTNGQVRISRTEVPSGTEVFDWTIPMEWSVGEAYIENENGERILDIKDNNLYLVGYSTPVDKWVDKEELLKYLYVQENQPDVVPYVTSYYKERYGFCMTKNMRDSLQEGKYHIYIASKLFNGSLTYEEVVIPGESEEEIFFSTYICHPSMANNECSGPALMVELINYVTSLENRRYTYRFLLIPETIGAITYMSKNLDYMQAHIAAGFNLTCVGDDRDYSIVHTRYANTLADKALTNILSQRGKYSDYSYLQRGSDERQYNSPLADLPIVTYCRSKFHTFPEYHTSADNMDLVSPEGFQGSYDVMRELIQALEYNFYYKIKVCCEPQLGKRGLYPTISKKGNADIVKSLMDFIAYADGSNDLFDISNIIGVPVRELLPEIKKLRENDLVEVN